MRALEPGWSGEASCGAPPTSASRRAPERRVAQRLFQPGPGDGLQHHPRVVGERPQLGVELAPQLVGGVLPGGAQVERQLDELLDARHVGVRPVGGERPVHAAESAPHRGEGLPEDRVRVLLDATEVIGTAEALGVDLVDVLGPRRAGREPAVLGDDLDAADRRAVARRRRRARAGSARRASSFARTLRPATACRARPSARASRASRCARTPARRTRASARASARRDRARCGP